MPTFASCLITEQVNGVFTITLNRPEKLNAFNREMARALLAAMEHAAGESTVRCIVLTGAGRAFSSGQDLAEALPAEGEPEIDVGATVRTVYNPIVRAIRTVEKPVLCAVNGIAAGAGANLALACDLTFASEEAVFVESFSRLGLIPDTGGTFMIPRLVGMQRATGMFFLAEKLSAADAKAWGLIWDVVPANMLMSHVHGIASRLAEQATRGFGLTKRALNASAGNGLEEQLEMEAQTMDEAGRTADCREAINAFLEKRSPKYTGA